MLLQSHRETVFLVELQLARKSGREFQPTCSRHKLAHGLVMRGQLLARNTTVTARALVGTDRCPTDRYLDADSPQFACGCLKFLEISQNLSKWPIPTRHTFKRAKALKIVPIGEILMQFALLIYEPPEAFAARKSNGTDPYTGAWRAYHKALVESGAYVAGDPLEVPETGTTVRLKDGKRRVQDGPFADTKEQLGGFIIMELPSLDAALDWAARCPTSSTGAVEVRPLAPAAKHRIM
jgi:hypothetical protein